MTQLNTGRAPGAAGDAPDAADLGGPPDRPSPCPPAGHACSDVPVLASGVNLIGEYEASGYTEAPCLVRRSDGQTIQLTPLLFATVELIDGQRDAAAIAEALGERIGKAVSADNVRYLVAEKLEPAGLVKDAHGSRPGGPEGQPPSRPADAAGDRQRAVHEPAVGTLLVPVQAVAPRPSAYSGSSPRCLGGRGQRRGGSTRELLYSPGLILAVFASMIVSASFHELGHAAGCRYSGGRPGVMGCGLYLVWPAFYTDVTDAYRLDRAGRLRTDLGGLYFNAIFAVGTFAHLGGHRCRGGAPAHPLQVLQMVHQLMPFVRMDGYHILSDLVGVPDLFARIKPTLLSFVPWRRTSDKALVLKPWVRVVVTLWVLIVVPLLLFCLLMVLITAPRVVATTWDSLGRQWQSVHKALTEKEWLAAPRALSARWPSPFPFSGRGTP